MLSTEKYFDGHVVGKSVIVTVILCRLGEGWKFSTYDSKIAAPNPSSLHGLSISVQTKCIC